MKLIIVESPGKIKKIQAAVGNTYKVLASMGHIVDLAKGGQYNMGIDLTNFSPKYVIQDDKRQTYSDILDAANISDEIFLATDDDREGNAIAWHIKTRLAGITVPIHRIKFKEINKKEILKGLKNTGVIDENLFKAQETRRILDRIAGFTTSPYVSKCFGNNLSAGRVQSAALKLITDRESAIDNFVPEKFWTIDVKLEKNKEKFAAKYDSKLSEEAKAKATFSKFKNTSTYEVSSVVFDDKKEFPQAPFITSTMQQYCASTHKLTPSDTMAAAQKLYESGLITYHRTDSLRAGEEPMEELRKFIKKSEYPLSTKTVVYKNKDAAQDAHECIRPSDITVSDISSEITDSNAKKVYKAIYDHFMMSQMAPAVFSTVKIVLISKEDATCQVKITGKMLKDKGYLAYSGKIPTGSLPSLAKGDILSLDPKDISFQEKKTNPPPRYNMSSFGKELVDLGIGRPATLAEISNRIENRHYVEKNSNDVYVPTDLGKKVSTKLTKFFKFVDAHYTANMETDLDQIAEGKLDNKKVLHKFWDELEHQLGDAYKELNIPMCPKCNSPLRELTNKNNNEQFLGCSGFPACKFTKSKESN